MYILQILLYSGGLVVDEKSFKFSSKVLNYKIPGSVLFAFTFTGSVMIWSNNSQLLTADRQAKFIVGQVWA